MVTLNKIVLYNEKAISFSIPFQYFQSYQWHMVQNIFNSLLGPLKQNIRLSAFRKQQHRYRIY